MGWSDQAVGLGQERGEREEREGIVAMEIKI
jgi:hypothetical protein